MLVAIVALSVAVRLAHLWFVYATPSFTHHRTWPVSDMYILNTWAGQIVDGDFLGRDLHHPLLDWMRAAAPPERWAAWLGEAPAFLKAPFYAYLLALLRWLFGDAMLPVVILQIAAAAGAVVLLYAITQALFGRAAGLAAALLFAVYAPAVHYDVVMLRGPWIVLAALLLTWQLVRMPVQPPGRAGVLTGACTGLALLVNEGFVLLPPLVAACAVLQAPRGGRSTMLAGFALALGLLLLPVVLRNLAVGVPPLQLSVSGAPMFAMFNAADSHPVIATTPPPSFLPLMDRSGGRLGGLLWPCFDTFRSAGDWILFYVRRFGALITPFEFPDNANFYYARLRSPVLATLPTYGVLVPLGVVGLALGLVVAPAPRRRLAPLLPASLALFVPLMATVPLSRYRVPLAVFWFPFAGFALTQIASCVQQRRWGMTSSVVAGLVAVGSISLWLEPHLGVDAGQLTNLRYRSPEFQLAAGAYAKADRPQDAAREWRQLAALTPDQSTRLRALKQAVPLQLASGDSAGARTTLAEIVAAARRNAQLLLWAGDVHRQQLGDARTAGELYERALALHPAADVTEALRARLADLGRTPAP